VILHTVVLNGLHWTVLLFAEKVLRSHRARDRRILLEITERLPGFNTRSYNRKEWRNYDWSTGGGEEWTESEAWKRSLVNDVMLRFIQPGKTILEIGPGAGRWSTVLASISRKLILVDLTEKSIQTCKERLSKYDHCVYVVNNGNSLSFLGENSVDYLWSFDVFVHIAPADTLKYLKELHRVFAPGATGIIHHPAAGGIKGGFRSSVTNEMFCEFLRECNFSIQQQIYTWGRSNQFSVAGHKDVITVFTKAT
jgi:ubiquinone/menaquinone biosynthesis C-methylase UbiE